MSLTAGGLVFSARPIKILPSLVFAKKEFGLVKGAPFLVLIKSGSGGQPCYAVANQDIF
jgi:hypothetical protein